MAKYPFNGLHPACTVRDKDMPGREDTAQAISDWAIMALPFYRISNWTKNGEPKSLPRERTFYLLRPEFRKSKYKESSHAWGTLKLQTPVAKRQKSVSLSLAAKEHADSLLGVRSFNDFIYTIRNILKNLGKRAPLKRFQDAALEFRNQCKEN